MKPPPYLVLKGSERLEAMVAGSLDLKVLSGNPGDSTAHVVVSFTPDVPLFTLVIGGTFTNHEILYELPLWSVVENDNQRFLLRDSDFGIVLHSLDASIPPINVAHLDESLEFRLISLHNQPGPFKAFYPLHKESA